MKLSIITINYNNVFGLLKTMESVLNQTSKDFEYIVVDGAAPLNPPDRGTLKQFVQEEFENQNGFQRCTWLSPFGGVGGGFCSESDSGIYNAMNKGIRMAKGEYVQFLNSGDCLVNNRVVETMLTQLRTKNSELRTIDILYGNMLKQLPKRIIRDRGFAGRMPTMLDFYTGTLNHSPTYIKRALFDTYGLYDETLKIVSDWKWYYQVIALNGITPVYIDMDVTIFDMNGISNTNSALDKTERRLVLKELITPAILTDYDKHWIDIEQMDRIKRFKLVYKMVWFIERCLFKLEKWERKRKKEHLYY